MTIKGFSKTVSYKSVKKLKDLNGRIAIDAMTELYRASLAMKSINGLTDSQGRPTQHISILLAVIREMHVAGVDQIWVFDAHKTKTDVFHNINKMKEVLNRRSRRADGEKKLSELKAKMVISDSDSDDEEQNNIDEIHRAEKMAFSMDERRINDLKFILNCLGIKWLEAPQGYEGECIAACLTLPDIDLADAVFSADADSLAYGASIWYRRNRQKGKSKEILCYDLNDVLDQIENKSDYDNVNLAHLQKLAVILGTDFAPKTPRIGPKSVFKKLKTTKLTKKQQQAMNEYDKMITLDQITINNTNEHPYKTKNINLLIEWLQKERNFSKKTIAQRLKIN